MNILVLTPWFPDHHNDQQGNFVLDSIDSLCLLGHRVHVLVTRPFVPSFLTGGKRSGCKAIRPEMFNRGFSLTCRQYMSIPRNYLRFISNRLYLASCTEAVRQAIDDNDIDVIHAHTEMPGYLACSAAEDTSVPVVTTLHGINLDRRYLSGLGQPGFLRRAFSSPQRLVIVGAPLFDFVRNHADTLDHVRVVYNGFREKDAAPFRMRRVLASPSKVNIVSVSNLVDGKGIDINLEALGRLEVSELPHWHYHVVGDGPLRAKLEARSRELNISDRVTFHGQCDHDTVYDLLSFCDLFSLPSSPEAFGVAYLEAMACGLLSIGVKGQGPSAFIEDGRTGILVRKRDSASLASRLLDIFNNKERYAGMAESGRDHVWQHFTWQSHARAMTAVFQEALECRSVMRQQTRKL